MKKRVLLLLLLAVMLVIACVVALRAGSVEISYREMFSGKINPDHELIINKIRMPRILLAVLVGGMLGIAGAVLQGLLKNPLVDPFITGISSGAALGATLAIAAGAGSIIVPSMAGALITILLVYRLSVVYGKLNIFNLLLVGVMAGSFFSAIIMLVNAVVLKDLVKVVFWLMGDLSSALPGYLYYIVPLALISLSAAVYFANDLNILTTGEEEAKSVGVRTEFIKTFYFILAGILTGAAVALSGIIGFVGLIVPHIIRFFTGPDMRVLIPASFLTGGIFLLCADTVARTVFLPGEIPVGVITGLIGAPVFIFLLLQGRKA